MDVVDTLVERAREAAVAAGRVFTALLDVDDAAIPGFGADEIAFALHWSQSAARNQLATARYLRDVLPEVFAALCTGDLDAYRAWVFVDVLATAEDTIAPLVAARVLPDAPTMTSTELRRKLRRVLIAMDPKGAAARTRRGVESRYVASTPDTDGTASLFGVRLPAARAASAFERVDAYARGAKSAGDERTLDQLRADTFLDLLHGVTLGTAPVHRQGVVELTVPLATATGQGDEPGDLAGYGPIDAEAVRAEDGTLFAHDRLRRRDRNSSHAAAASQPPMKANPQPSTPQPPTKTNSQPSTPRPQKETNPQPAISQPPTKTNRQSSALRPPTKTNPWPPTPQPSTETDSQPLAPQSRTETNPPPLAPRPPMEVDPTRRSPGPTLARWIVARDQTCRAPGCTAPARSCDIDHTIDHAIGGLTSHDNLGLLCRHHHRLKHDGGWQLTQPTPGTFEWRSPTGRVYRT